MDHHGKRPAHPRIPHQAALRFGRANHPIGDGGCPRAHKFPSRVAWAVGLAGRRGWTMEHRGFGRVRRAAGHRGGGCGAHPIRGWGVHHDKRCGVCGHPSGRPEHHHPGGSSRQPCRRGSVLRGHDLGSSGESGCRAKRGSRDGKPVGADPMEQPLVHRVCPFERVPSPQRGRHGQGSREGRFCLDAQPEPSPRIPVHGRAGAFVVDGPQPGRSQGGRGGVREFVERCHRAGERHVGGGFVVLD